jgi:UDPglucose 6-dehydrogenase
MKICVLGLWHLGTVTAACLASAGHDVIGLDFESNTIQHLSEGIPPVYEPELESLVKQGLSSGKLKFTTDISEATDGVDLLWVAYDTPVNDDDIADVSFVLDRANRVLSQLSHPVTVLISSQLPVGSTRTIESMYRSSRPDNDVTFASSPENLRLGKAIAAFTRPGRVIVGIRDERQRPLLQSLFRPFTNQIEFMSVESAEMTKHALNAFLATSVSFINEVAVICEHVGADAKEVERGLKTEERIGSKAYLSPGAAFAGGTLARDVLFLEGIARENRISTDLLSGVRTSNNNHRRWIQRKLIDVFGNLGGLTIALWGLTYKAGTDTLRRSGAIELCEWLIAENATIRAHDPAVKVLPPDLSEKIHLCDGAVDAVRDADALVIATGWPEYASADFPAVTSLMRSALIIDPMRFVAAHISMNPSIRYFTVGKS